MYSFLRKLCYNGNVKVRVGGVYICFVVIVALKTKQEVDSVNLVEENKIKYLKKNKLIKKEKNS